jgi:hypothetical protein
LAPKVGRLAPSWAGKDGALNRLQYALHLEYPDNNTISLRPYCAKEQFSYII